MQRKKKLVLEGLVVQSFVASPAESVLRPEVSDGCDNSVETCGGDRCCTGEASGCMT